MEKFTAYKEGFCPVCKKRVFLFAFEGDGILAYVCHNITEHPKEKNETEMVVSRSKLPELPSSGGYQRR